MHVANVTETVNLFGKLGSLATTSIDFRLVMFEYIRICCVKLSFVAVVPYIYIYIYIADGNSMFATPLVGRSVRLSNLGPGQYLDG